MCQIPLTCFISTQMHKGCINFGAKDLVGVSFEDNSMMCLRGFGEDHSML